MNRAYTTNATVFSLDMTFELDAQRRSWREAIYVSLNDYKEGKRIKMLFGAHALRQLGYAARDHAYGNPQRYAKFTRSGGLTKMLAIAAAQERFFINVSQKEANGAELKLSHPFTRYELLAFADTVTQMATMAERRVFELAAKLEGK